MIIKVEGGEGTLKLSCKAVQCVVSFSTLRLEVGGCAQMKAWSTDSPHFPLSAVQQTDTQRGLSLLSPFFAVKQAGKKEHMYSVTITFVSCDSN